MKKVISILMASLVMVVSFMSAMADAPIVTNEIVIPTIKNANFASPTTPGAPTNWTVSTTPPATVVTYYTDATHGNSLRVTDTSSGACAAYSSYIPVTSDMLNTTFTLSFDAKRASAANDGKANVTIKAYNINGAVTTAVSNVVPNFSFGLSSGVTVWSTATPTFKLSTLITSYQLKPDGVTYYNVNDITHFRIMISTSAAANTIDMVIDNLVLTYPGQRTVNLPIAKDANNDALTYLKTTDSGTTVNASVTIDDTIFKSYPTAVITALYDGEDKLIGVGNADNSAKLTGNNTITSSVAIPEGDIAGKKLKIFVWDLLSVMKPIFSPVVITDTQPQ